MIVEFDDGTYADLIQILQEKFFQTTNILELQKINNIYKQLNFKSESWLSPSDKKRGTSHVQY